MATAAEQPKTATKTPEPREYMVLMETITGDDNPAWLEVGTATAATKEAAREEVVDKLPDDEQDGTFIVIAARYWVKSSPTIEVKKTRSWT